MNTVLVVYTTNSGSTAEVARAIGEELSREGAAVEVRPLAEVTEVSGYQAVIVGGPMILGWHRDAVAFLKRHQEALRDKPVAYFFTALSLTRSGENHLNGCTVFQDPALAKAPHDPAKLSFKEKYASVASYLEPPFTQAPQEHPVSAAFFAGALDYGKLSLFQKLFVRFIIGAQAGDFRNWEAIRSWAADLRPRLTA